MSLGCHNRPFMSSLSWFSCSTGLEPDPGGGAEWEEEREELNQFTATGLRRDKGRRTKVTPELDEQSRASCPEKRQLFQRDNTCRGQWKYVKRTRISKKAFSQHREEAAVMFHLWPTEHLHTSLILIHTTNRKQMRGNYNSIKRHRERNRFLALCIKFVLGLW